MQWMLEVLKLPHKANYFIDLEIVVYAFLRGLLKYRGLIPVKKSKNFNLA